MMREVQSLTLSICVLCTMAGLVRLLSPSGGFKAVINGALLLYILATVTHMAHNADWSSFTRQIYSWQQSESISVPDYSDYASDVAAGATVVEINKALLDGGIKANTKLSGNICTVRLYSADDLPAAKAILEAQSKTLQYRFEVEEDDR